MGRRWTEAQDQTLLALWPRAHDIAAAIGRSATAVSQRAQMLRTGQAQAARDRCVVRAFNRDLNAGHTSAQAMAIVGEDYGLNRAQLRQILARSRQPRLPMRAAN
jgi:hypothetical protein